MSSDILRFSLKMTLLFGTGKHSYLKEIFLVFAALLFAGVKEEQFEYLCIPFPKVPVSVLTRSCQLAKRF